MTCHNETHNDIECVEYGCRVTCRYVGVSVLVLRALDARFPSLFLSMNEQTRTDFDS
jgi:hypothetical protein